MALQDALWLGRHHVQIPSRTRRELARDFDLADHLGYTDRFMALLSRLWHLDNDPLGGWTTTTNSLRSQIERHVIRFPDDRATLRAARCLRSTAPPLRTLPRGPGIPRRPTRRAGAAPLRRTG
ncbi:AbiJ-related protein [Streptomyces nodosus]|uniref:AbiJ-related protein n=1 Tax=Streptomyces nodosus TaxID=40318 RepID=UPI0037F9CA7C